MKKGSQGSVYWCPGGSERSLVRGYVWAPVSFGPFLGIRPSRMQHSVKGMEPMK